MIQSAADDLLADDGPQDRRAAEAAHRFRPAVTHPVRVVQRAENAEVLLLMGVQ